MGIFAYGKRPGIAGAHKLCFHFHAALGTDGQNMAGTFTKGCVDAAAEGDDLLIFAEDGEELVGFLSVSRESCRRNRHSAYLVCGVRQKYWNRGIAKMFFRMLDDWAEEKGVKRVELVVRKDNYVARHVYERHGFGYEGEHKMAMLIDGEYYSEVHMAKLFD